MLDVELLGVKTVREILRVDEAQKLARTARLWKAYIRIMDVALYEPGWKVRVGLSKKAKG